jgi:hypothetical protein
VNNWLQVDFSKSVPPPGLGTRIATLLRRLGIERLVYRLKPQGCGCQARAAWLDRHFPLRWLTRRRPK